MLIFESPSHLIEILLKSDLRPTIIMKNLPIIEPDLIKIINLFLKGLSGNFQFSYKFKINYSVINLRNSTIF